MTDLEAVRRVYPDMDWCHCSNANHGCEQCEKEMVELAAVRAEGRLEGLREAAMGEGMRMLAFIDQLADAFAKDGKVFSAATIRSELRAARISIARLAAEEEPKP